jgi:glycosyltransferase involved in cell wall biosynthesis
MKLGGYPAYRLWSRAETRKRVDGLIAYSEFMRAVHDRSVPGPVEHISLGVDLSDRPTERPARPRTPVRFGFLGGFQEHKGIWDLLDATARLNHRGLCFELHIWGPSQEAGPVRERGLEGRVTLHGMFAAGQRWPVYEQIDVLLMASRDEEPYGRVIQEAAAVGVPAIAPATGGIAEQIRDGIDGLLFRVRDSRDLEARMERVIAEPSLVTRLSENLWTVVDTRDAVAKIEDFYFRVLHDRNRGLPVMTPKHESD